ncbi:hypothetical protein C7974DRAFT_428549 [Boeremia exigua]|uniref:uncharacterized protein n=1 Tax=Boeremia exigua TaxID=749465 RepID=UPI001E8D0E2D|nr:uncharacterized protein C7974DRAFT_428549 [Boeremia exigua]KAH6614124.1 hypothetical protein C7974DRAFT_428549 [Boeremia exigua]
MMARVIKDQLDNCMLIACALDEWNEADHWRLSAEQTYHTSINEDTHKKDVNSLMEELTGVDEEEKCADHGEDLDEEMADPTLEEYYYEDAEAVAQAGNEVQVAADVIRLPIRSTGAFAQDFDTAEPPALHIIAPTPLQHDETTHLTKGTKLRRQRSTRFNRGGAFHAQEFANSFKKTPSSSRASILDMEWEQRKWRTVCLLLAFSQRW